MKEFKISNRTIEEIEKYLNNVDLNGSNGLVQLDNIEFEQGNNIIYVDAAVEGHYKEDVNERYGGYEDDCSEWVIDEIRIGDVVAYDEDGNEMKVVNANEIAA